MQVYEVTLVFPFCFFSTLQMWLLFYTYGLCSRLFQIVFIFLKTPWFEMILWPSTTKKKKSQQKTIQPLQHFVLPVSLLCCLRENKKQLLLSVIPAQLFQHEAFSLLFVLFSCYNHPFYLVWVLQVLIYALSRLRTHPPHLVRN